MQEWAPRRILGRIYLATEGINAQMTVPSSEISNFLPNIMKRFSLSFTPTIVQLPRTEKAPFKALHIRVRPQIVADRLSEQLDLTNTGEELSPGEWHEALTATQNPSATSPRPLLIDCRNQYEAELGTFVGASPVPVHRFSETFAALDEIIKKRESDTKEAMIFCTGGIRCEKARSPTIFTTQMQLIGRDRLERT